MLPDEPIRRLHQLGDGTSYGTRVELARARSWSLAQVVAMDDCHLHNPMNSIHVRYVVSSKVDDGVDEVFADNDTADGFPVRRIFSEQETYRLEC